MSLKWRALSARYLAGLKRAMPRGAFFVDALEPRMLLTGLAGDIFVSLAGNSSGGSVIRYDATGTQIGAAFLSNLPGGDGVFISGTDLFILNTFQDTIGKYTITGQTINANLIQTPPLPSSIVADGDALFVANFDGGVSEYTTAGLTVNSTLIGGFTNPSGIALVGSSLFVEDFGAGTVGQFSTTGTAIAPLLITGLDQPFTLAASDDDLYVATRTTISEYTTSGSLVRANLIGSFGDIQSIAFANSTLYVLDGLSETVGAYSADGTPISANLITGLQQGAGLFIEPDTVGPAAQLCFDQPPSRVNAGAPIAGGITVDVQDQEFNTVPGDSSTVTLTIAGGPSGVLGGTTSVQAVNGVATFRDISLLALGSYTLTASDGNLVVASLPITALGPPVQLSFVSQPGDTLAGSTISPAITVEELDANGNVLTTDSSSPVTLSVVGSQTVLQGTTTESMQSGVATFSDLSLDTPGTYTLQATSGDLSDAETFSFLINASTFSAAAFFPMNAGQNLDYSGTYDESAINQDDDGATDVTATAQTTVGGLHATRFDDTATVDTTNGHHASAKESRYFSLNSNGLEFLGETTVGGAVTLGRPIPVLKAQASVGDVLTWSDVPLSAVFSRNGITARGTGTDTGSSTVVDIEEVDLPGFESFEAYQVDLVHSEDYVVRADGQQVTLHADISETFWIAQGIGIIQFSGSVDLEAEQDSWHKLNVNVDEFMSLADPGTPATHLVITGQPASAVAGNSLGSTVTVMVEDAHNRVVISDDSDVTVSVPRSNSTLAGTTRVETVNGVATFTDLSMDQAGTYTLEAADADDLLGGTFSSKFVISADSMGGRLVVLHQPGTGVAGRALSPALVLQVQDEFNNPISKIGASNVTLSIVGGPSAGSLTAASAALSKGMASFSRTTFSSAGAYTLLATDPNLPDPTSAPIDITIEPGTSLISAPQVARSYPAGPSIILQAAFRSDVPAGIPFTGTATLMDQNSDLLATGTLTAAGTATFAIDSLTAGTYTCIIEYAGDVNHVNGTSSHFTLKLV